MISIIIPTYNRLQTLTRCIESILPQVTKDLEVIVVDDFSQDATKDYLLGLSRTYPFIKLIFNNKNFGVNYTRNRGIELASQKYILFLDSDDALAAGCLEKIERTLETYPQNKHFLFIISDRSAEFADLIAPREVSYKDWISGKVSHDFTHVISTDTMKKYLFFEEFRMFEHLNWLRIKKETSPQLLVPVIALERDKDRPDSLGTLARLKSLATISTRFKAEHRYYVMYHDDLKIHNPKSLTYPLVETILLGVASGFKSDCRLLINYAHTPLIKWLGNLSLLVPSSVLKYAIIKYSSLKRRN